MKKRRFRQILKKYRRGKASGEESALVEGWYNHHTKQVCGDLPDVDTIEQDVQKIWERISTEQVPVKSVRRFRAMVAASIVVFFLLFSAILYVAIDYRQPVLKRAAPSEFLYLLHDVRQEVGGYDAYVQLSSGGRVNLESIPSDYGFSDSNEKFSFSKDADGAIVYQFEMNKWEEYRASRAMHTVHVPKAKQTQLVLSDGTKVWLNSGSSISFPEAFSWNERRVEISGEVYFEVVRDTEKPFYVEAENIIIKVLGTSFNVSAYPDEPLVTTALVSGAVEVSAKAVASDVWGQGKEMYRSLSPGQQWSLDGRNGHVSVGRVDVWDIVSWKDGLLAFTNLDLKAIMRKASRWYDVEVEYESYDPKRRFTGGISSRTTLDEFVRIMSLYRVKIEQRKGKLVVVDD